MKIEISIVIIFYPYRPALTTVCVCVKVDYSKQSLKNKESDLPDTYTLVFLSVSTSNHPADRGTLDILYSGALQSNNYSCFPDNRRAQIQLLKVL